jgi:hypothetical protein
MIKTWTRREVIAASVGLSAISPGISVPGLAPAATARPDQSGDGKRVTLLHFTDTHAQLETHPEYLPGAKPEIQMMGGYARLKTAIEHERAHCEGACFLLDGGDEFQGSGPAAWSEGEVILEPLKALGIDVFTPGNWEPAYGPERFKQTMARLDCPVVCYNFHDTTTESRLFPASIALERQGVKIAVVGLTDIGASERQPPAEFRGMDTTRIEGLREFVKELRSRERPDLVVALKPAYRLPARSPARRQSSTWFSPAIPMSGQPGPSLKAIASSSSRAASDHFWAGWISPSSPEEVSRAMSSGSSRSSRAVMTRTPTSRRWLTNHWRPIEHAWPGRREKPKPF